MPAKRVPPLTWTTVESSCVDAIRWADDTLFVRYKDKHGVITGIVAYEQKFEEDFWEMLEAGSKGKYMWAYLYHWPHQYRVM